MTTHELARKLLDGPDVRVAVQRSLKPYIMNLTDFRVHPNGERLMFDGDQKVQGETTEQVFWITGPLI